MGMRKYKREIARQRMRTVGVGNVNKKMGKIVRGVSAWRLALKPGKRAQA